MPRRPFNRQEHVYRNDAFAELVKDGVRFFNGTPIRLTNVGLTQCTS